MKKIICMFIGVIMLMSLGGCGGEINNDKYVVFESLSPDSEDHKLTYPGTLEVSVEYDPAKSYSFRAIAYYEASDLATGESYMDNRYYSEPDTYFITLNVHLEDEGYRYFTLKFTILPPPDTRVMPEYRFDPNGAVEYRENEYYKYEYDGKEKYPISQIFYQNEEIEKMYSYEKNNMSSCIDGENNLVYLPKNVGIYKLTYQINYAREEDEKRFHTIYIQITVEIVDQIVD